ncbi:MAG TPA: DUF6089 family protein [Chitinophagaceae bacterium]|nr:DUF6089 family protein [Chitinophagaceae bacterium]
MKILLTILLFSCFTFHVTAQRVHVGVAGGLANYNGDLLEKFYVNKQTNGFIGATVHYELQDQILLRAGFSFARLNGSDKYNSKPNLQMRNLHFETALTEFSLVGEYYLFNLYEKNYSPYVFAGLALFHFNPYTYDATKQKIFLKPLSTEGQGIYPEKKAYSLLQPAIPFGGGFKYAVSENVRIGIEFGMRKIFTDYLDDVSTTYADYNDLLLAKGSQATDLAYREDEYPGGNPAYPTKDTQRGSNKQKDVYYFTGLNLTLRLGGGSGAGESFKISGKNKLGCPSVPQ